MLPELALYGPLEDKEVFDNVIRCFSFKKSHWLAIVTVGCVMSCLVKILVMIIVIGVKDAHYAHKKLRACTKYKLYIKSLRVRLLKTRKKYMVRLD